MLSEAQGDGSPMSRFFDPSFAPGDKIMLALLNLTVIGQDVILHLGWDGQGGLTWSDTPFSQGGNEVYKFMVIPVAWTLALELYFYMLAPFIVRRPVWQIALIAAAAMGLRIAAAMGGLFGDPFSYRFFPFELSLFLAGAIGYKVFAANPARWQGLGPRLFALTVPLAILAWPVLLGDWSENHFFTPARIGVLALVALALPAVHGWSRNWRFDRQFGELSYPLYLCHLLVIAVLAGIPAVTQNHWLHSLAIIVVSMTLSWVVVRFLEAPVELLRSRIRRRAEGVEEPQSPAIAVPEPQRS
jgi:peptidoglycan/LPS O-acetylase OafA/YrhL